MSDFPSSSFSLARTSIVSTGLQSPAGDANLNSVLNGSSGTWPAANRAIYIPVGIERSVVVDRMGVYNGSAVAGTVDIGVYSQFGVKIVSTGATTQAGTSAVQVIDVTNTTLAPGTYYLALLLSSASGTTIRTTLNSLVLTACSCAQEEVGSGTLPSTATFATMANSYLPIFGAYFATVL